MPYTLLKFLVWGVLLAVLGGLVGWALRSLKARAVRGPATSSLDDADVEELRGQIADLEAECDRLRTQLEGIDAGASHGTADAEPGPTLDDDLTVIDGIGPKIAALCAGIGVSTWAELAHTDQSTLRSMLDDAGTPYKTRDPSSWPRQAALLASGRWDEFEALTHEDR
ncbi:hypothetical protein [Ilumatobacter sp.]|uniref:hypothetical protein n=1 Tax=Ilumatobacter sp. TaxID=1967498 RepID=UPI003C39B140